MTAYTDFNSAVTGLSSQPTVRLLTLTQADMRGFEKFCNNLPAATCTDLEFSGCKFETGNNFGTLCACLVGSDSIINLTFEECKFLESCDKAFIMLLSDKKKKLKALTLKKCGNVTDATVANILKKAVSSELVMINISDHNLGDFTAEAASFLISKSRKLTSLKLQNNHLRNDHLTIICKTAVLNKTLSKLWLDGNDATPTGIASCKAILNKRKNNEESIFDFKLGDSDPIMEQKAKDFGKVLRKAIESEHKVKHNRAKLMIVGRAEAGKSVTLKNLFDQELDSTYNSTVVADHKEAKLKLTSGSHWHEINHADSFGNEYGNYTRKLNENSGIPAETTTINNDTKLTKNRKQPFKFIPSLLRRTVNEKKIETHLIEQKIHRDLLNESQAKYIEMNGEQTYHWVAEAERIAETDSDKVLLSIWDFGGQRVFRVTQHLLITDSGIIFLVFDLAKLTNESTDFKLKLTPSTDAIHNNGETQLESLKSWLQAFSHQQNTIPVLLVGTHYDLILQQPNIDLGEWHKSITDCLFTVLNDNDAIKTIITTKDKKLFFPLININVPEEQAALLKEAILLKEDIRTTVNDVFKNRYSSQLISVRYLSEEIKLGHVVFMKFVLEESQGKPYMAFSEVMILAERNNISEIEAKEVLKRYHQLGCILYFHMENKTLPFSENLVILKPQWLIAAAARIIFDSDIHMQVELAAAEANLLQPYINTGIITLDLLKKQRWATLTESEVKYLLKLFEVKLIISPYLWEEVSENESVNYEKRYIVSAMNRNQGQFRLPHSPYRVCIHFKPGIPNGYFERLISYLVLLSGRTNGSDEPSLRQNEAYFSFSLDRGVQVVLMSERSLIEFYVANNDVQVIPELIDLVKKCSTKIRTEDQSGIRWTDAILLHAKDGETNRDYFLEYESIKKYRASHSSRAGNSRQPVDYFENKHVDLDLFSVFFAGNHGRVRTPSHDLYMCHAFGSARTRVTVHEKMMIFSDRLKEKKTDLHIWCDGDESRPLFFRQDSLKEHINRSTHIAICLTKKYLKLIEEEDTDCYCELVLAAKKKSSVILIILEEEVGDANFWPERLKTTLSNFKVISMYSEEDEDTGLNKIFEILK